MIAIAAVMILLTKLSDPTPLLLNRESPMRKKENKIKEVDMIKGPSRQRPIKARRKGPSAPDLWHDKQGGADAVTL